MPAIIIITGKCCITQVVSHQRSKGTSKARGKIPFETNLCLLFGSDICRPMPQGVIAGYCRNSLKTIAFCDWGSFLSFADSPKNTLCSYKSVLKFQHKYWNPGCVWVLFLLYFPMIKVSLCTYYYLPIQDLFFSISKGDKYQKYRNLS